MMDPNRPLTLAWPEPYQLCLDLPPGWLSAGEHLRITDVEREWIGFDLIPGHGIVYPKVRQWWVHREGEHFYPGEPFDGVPAWITPVREPLESTHPKLYSALGPVVDLVAWHPDAPGVHALRCGNATVLGNIGPQELMADPVPVWRSVARWYESGCNGVVFLTADWRDMQPILERIDTVQAEDEAHAAELAEIMQRRHREPIIRVAKKS